MSQLDEIIAKLTLLPPKELEAVESNAIEATKEIKWVPNPGPQTRAYFSEADVLLYGGEPGGGKSQLILGLAHNCHQRSLIMRREYGDLDRLIDDTLKIHGSRDGYNGSPPPKLRISDKQIIDFAAAHRVGDEQGQMGRGHDLLGLDEGTHFAESQVRFLMGWVRSEDRNQRCRVVIATNPPLRPEGLWVTKMFAPWLDPRFPNPAKDGELRWVISDEDGNDLWVDGPDDAREILGKVRRPMSRTYIHSSVKDNPYYVGSDYERQLDALSEPWRSLLMGGFKTAFKDQEDQIIPTAWVVAAQKRWTKTPPPEVPMCCIGVDASGGSNDPMVIARRYDGWFAPLIRIPAKDIPQDRAGSYCAGQIVSFRRDEALIVIDLGGGYGNSAYEHLKLNEIDVKGYKGAEGTTRRAQMGKHKFANKRTAAYWLFREALDPDQPGGSPIMLPDDPELVADLTSVTCEFMPNGVRAESKDDVCKRLGRSTDSGDAVLMAWFEGATKKTAALEWMEQGWKFGNKKPQIINSGRQPLSAQRRAA